MTRRYIHRGKSVPVKVKIRGVKTRFYGVLNRSSETLYTESGSIEFHDKEHLNEFFKNNRYKVVDPKECPEGSFDFLKDVVRRQKSMSHNIGGKSIAGHIQCPECCSIQIKGLCPNCGKGNRQMFSGDF